MKQKSVSGVLTPNFTPKKGGGWLSGYSLSAIRGVGGLKQLAMTAQVIKKRCFPFYKRQEF
ncbi:hypothetical protein FIM34_04715 [Helicobacter pylori]|nr:hypothetical protein FIM34_04715 [Helicobacter pylori]